MPSSGGLTGSQRGDVSVTPVSGKHGQHHGAEQIAFARGVRAGQMQWTIRHPGVKQIGLLQKIDEEGQLPKGCHRCRGVPLNMNPPGERVRDRGPVFNCRLFTRWVSDRTWVRMWHSGRIQRLSGGWQSSNCRI